MKEQLAQLIEAYAAARFSGNGLLQQFATAQLQGLLEQVDVVKIDPPAAEPAEAVTAEVA